jgi:hypothetical protein
MHIRNRDHVPPGFHTAIYLVCVEWRVERRRIRSQSQSQLIPIAVWVVYPSAITPNQAEPRKQFSTHVEIIFIPLPMQSASVPLAPDPTAEET